MRTFMLRFVNIKAAVATVLFIGLVLLIAAGGLHGLGWSAIGHQADAWRTWIEANPLTGVAAFFAIYVVSVALSLPGAAALTLVGGSLFGFVTGTLLVSFASVAGATLAMLAARFLLRDLVERRFGKWIKVINQGVERDGPLYLFWLRLIPVFPFFIVNLAMGLTRMRPRTFAWVSQLGMLPLTMVYVNAGSQLTAVHEARDLLSVRLFLALAAIAVLPLGLRIGRVLLKRRDLDRRWPRPKAFDYNLVVIGAGSAGLVTSYLAAMANARVALVEHDRMGGDCLNTGCVPSKALIRSAKLASEARYPERFGLRGQLEPDFPAVMARVRGVIARVAPHDSAERYAGLGVEVITGAARVTSPWTVAVGDRTLTTRAIVIATGAEPAMPPIPGLEEVQPLTSETVWSLGDRPTSLLIIGGGAIGCELAQAFARLGSRTVLVEAGPRLLAREDADLAEAISARLSMDGVEVMTGLAISRAERTEAGAVIHFANGSSLRCDQVLVAVGRRPRTRGFGLEELGLLDDGRLAVDDRLRTRLPNILAAGDVIGQLQFTHAAGHYAWFAAMNALFGSLRRWQVDMTAFPVVIYTDPEAARVGMTEDEARAQGVAYDVTRYDLAELDRAITDGANHGFVKVLTAPGRDRILGAAIVGAHAGDMLAEFTLAMRHGLGLSAILRTIHPYPGWAEANRAVAGEWRRHHAPGWALRLSGRWLRWQRGRRP